MKRSKKPERPVIPSVPDVPAQPAPVVAAALAEDMFLDRRSGRDRRDVHAVGTGNVRGKTDRRIGIGIVGRAGLTGGAWWLQRGYVDSHHFVENAITLSPLMQPGARG